MKKLLILLLFSTQVLAWTHIDSTRPRFPTSTVVINISSSSCATAGLTASELLSYAMLAANQYWNDVPTSSLTIVAGTTNGNAMDSYTSVSSIISNAGSANSILIGCNNSIPDFIAEPNILGAGDIVCSARQCRGALALNSAPGTAVASQTPNEIVATIAHEIGHALGLGHSSDEIALMYYSTGVKNQPYLTQDDVDGISFLYPNEEEAGCLLGSMGTIKYINDDDHRNNFLGSLALGFCLIFILNFMQGIWRRRRAELLLRR